MKKLNSIQFYGMPLPIYAFFAIIVLACAYFNIIPNQMIGAVAVLFAFGILIGEIGERLPIWNKFLGGGAMLCFLAAGLLKYFNLLPECVTNVSDGWINGYSFLNIFITFLVVGSLLGIDRDVLIKSGSLYIPTLLCSLLGACVFGVVAGLIFGNDPLYLITSYVLPIMGGGAGAGPASMPPGGWGAPPWLGNCFSRTIRPGGRNSPGPCATSTGSGRPLRRRSIPSARPWPRPGRRGTPWCWPGSNGTRGWWASWPPVWRRSTPARRL